MCCLGQASTTYRDRFARSSGRRTHLCFLLSRSHLKHITPMIFLECAFRIRGQGQERISQPQLGYKLAGSSIFNLTRPPMAAKPGCRWRLRPSAAGGHVECHERRMSAISLQLGQPCRSLASDCHIELSKVRVSPWDGEEDGPER